MGGSVDTRCRTDSLIARRIRFRCVARLSIFVETIKVNRGVPIVFLYTNSIILLRARIPLRKSGGISSLGSLLGAGSMKLNTDAAPTHQAAVFQHFAAAERAHPQAKSVFPDMFFLFRLIHALGHGDSIAIFALSYNTPVYNWNTPQWQKKQRSVVSRSVVYGLGR